MDWSAQPPAQEGREGGREMEVGVGCESLQLIVREMVIVKKLLIKKSFTSGYEWNVNVAYDVAYIL